MVRSPEPSKSSSISYLKISIAPAQAKRIAVGIVGLFVLTLALIVAAISLANDYCRQWRQCPGGTAVFRIGCECIRSVPIRED
jgi:hypothetical protein